MAESVEVVETGREELQKAVGVVEVSAERVLIRASSVGLGTLQQASAAE